MLQETFYNPSIVIVLVGALVGIASSLLGAFLVLRKSSLLADAISHSILLGIILVYLITKNQFSPFYTLGAALVGVLTVALTELLANSKRVKNDAAIGLVYPLLFAVAVLLINVFARNVHVDQDAVLLGEIGFVWIDTVNVGGLEVPRALITMLVITLVNLLFVTFFFKELKLATFDPSLAAALGFSPMLIYYLLLSLTSITAVTAFDSVGAILLVAFVIVPPATAYLLTDKLWWMLVYGVLFSSVSSLLGYVFAVVFDVSIGGMMVCISGAFLLLAFLFSPRYGLIAQTIQRSNQRRDNAERMLLVHLYNHEHDDESLEESAVDALQTHLRWRDHEARNIVMRSLEQNVIRKEQDKLFLTEKGRVLAREVLEPWRTRAQSS
ncbi:MAG: metal ABC transporter permease [Trueperaceae bacterium]